MRLSPFLEILPVRLLLCSHDDVNIFFKRYELCISNNKKQTYNIQVYCLYRLDC